MRPVDPRKIEVIDDATAAMLRSKTVAEKLAMLDQMWVFARELVTAGVKDQHPEWSELQVRREVARRMSHGAVDPDALG